MFSHSDFIDSVNNFSPLGKGNRCIIQCFCSVSGLELNKAVKYNYDKGAYVSFALWLKAYLSALVPYIDDSVKQLDIESILLHLGKDDVNNL